MSQTEMHIGILKKVPLLNDLETIEEVSNRLLIAVNVERDLDYTTAFEQLKSDFYYKYFIYKECLYEAIDEEFDDGDDICKAKEESDETISYSLRFYNGGTCMSEMMESALNKLNK